MCGISVILKSIHKHCSSSVVDKMNREVHHRGPDGQQTRFISFNDRIVISHKPENENIKIWRFLDFTKFVSVLDTKSLFFSRLDLLGDPFEGSYPKFIYDNKKHFKGIEKKLVNIMLKKSSQFRRHFAVNCWHINEYESAGMWSLYLKNKDGVAIQTTFKGLADSYKKTKEYITIGQVNYIDYDQEGFSIGNVFHPIFHKRKSFEHEKELRATIW